MPHRSRTDIIIQILEIANGRSGATKTKIFYNAFLNYQQLKDYLTILIEGGLLGYDSIMCTFKTTEKGRMLLQAYNQIDQILRTTTNLGIKGEKP
jgi:predicted transcriptional regulator